MFGRQEKFPESSVPLDAKWMTKITRVVESGIADLNDAVKREGAIKVFRKTYNHLPAQLRYSLRGLINTYYPDYRVPFDQDPEAKALEYGLVMGIKLGQLSLDRYACDNFCAQVDVNNIQLINARGLREEDSRAKDLIATVQIGGTFVDNFGYAFSRDVLLYETDDNPEATRLNSLYRNALGYHGALMQSYVEATYVRQVQPINVASRFEIARDIELLESLPEKDIPNFF